MDFANLTVFISSSIYQIYRVAPWRDSISELELMPEQDIPKHSWIVSIAYNNNHKLPMHGRLTLRQEYGLL